MSKKVEHIAISKICNTINGLWTGKKEPLIDVKAYTMSNFTKESDLNLMTEPREIKANANDFEKRKLQYGDILIEKSGGGPNQPVGRAILFSVQNNEKNTFSNFTTRLRIKNEFEPKVNQKYLHYFLKRAYMLGETEKFQKNSTNIRNLQLKEYLELQLPLFNTQEQKQIVAILDEAFEAIDQAKANIEKNIQNAKELFQSKLNEIFSQKGAGWEEKSFQELSTRIGDGLHGTPKYDDNGDYYFINGNNLNNGRIEIKEGTKRINKEEFLLHKRELNENTVLVSINGTLGNIAFFDNEPIILGKSACYINFKPEVYKHYVKYLIKSPLFFKNMTDESTGATIKNFSLKSMRNYKFHLPPLEIQIQIVENLENIEGEIDTLIVALEKKSKNMDELKKSILQKAFAGELTYKSVSV